jgi:uncharacterized membrane protein
MNNLLKIIILTILPISELRGGIPLAFALGFSPLTAFLLCTLVNIAMIPIAFLFLDTLNNLFLHIKWYNKLFHKVLERARYRVHNKVEKYGYLGLLIVVSIPLPLFGAYTGVLGSWALGMDKKKSFACIALGTVIAGIIVTLITYSGFRLYQGT